MKRSTTLMAIAALGACAGDMGADQPPDGGLSDAASCDSAISFDPPFPVADPIAPIRAAVTIAGASGVLDYTWTVTHNGAPVSFTKEAFDFSQIGFIAITPGPYYVSVAIGGPGTPPGCSNLSSPLNVEDPNGNVITYRMRTVPPPSLAPPQEQIIQVRGGADYARDIALDPGLSAAGTVRNGAAGPGIQAYLRFMPVSAPRAFTEAFSTVAGNYSMRLLGQTHDVLVVPTGAGLAPKLVTWTPATTTLVVGAGTLVGGFVRNPAGIGLAGAKVQLYAGIVPSTLATTAGDGSFSVRSDFPAGTPVTVKVTPPATSGLPRLEATGTFNLGVSMQINYGATLATCDLANTPVQRNSVNRAGAKVTVVGTLAGAAGTVSAGVTANATGTVRVAATASGGGLLPSMLVPRAPLAAVVELSAADFAVDTSVDTSACPALIIDAPPQITVNGVARNAAMVLPDVRIEATPTGTLALADVAPVTTTALAGGAFTIALASGGRYDVRFIDPQTRAATLVSLDVPPASVPTNALLPKALTISGKVGVTGLANPVQAASVQLLCGACTGIDAARPIAQTATDLFGAYRIAVLDPGTM